MVILYSKISQTLLDILAAVSEEPVYVQAFSSAQVLQRLVDSFPIAEVCTDATIEEARAQVQALLSGNLPNKPLIISAAEYYHIPQKSMLRVVRTYQTRPLIRLLCSFPLIVRKIIKELLVIYIGQDANIHVLEY